MCNVGLAANSDSFAELSGLERKLSGAGSKTFAELRGVEGKLRRANVVCEFLF